MALVAHVEQIIVIEWVKYRNHYFGWKTRGNYDLGYVGGGG